MSSGKGIAFLNEFIESSDNFNRSQEDAYRDGVARFSAIEFQTSIEVVITLEQIGFVIYKVAKTPLRIGFDVYDKAFSQSTRVYIRDARSLFEMLEIFTMKMGLLWRISEDGAVEVCREKFDNLKIDKVADASQEMCIENFSNFEKKVELIRKIYQNI